MSLSTAVASSAPTPATAPSLPLVEAAINADPVRSAKRDSVQKEITRMQRLLAETLADIEQTERDLETVNATIGKEKQRKDDLLDQLDVLEREAPRLQERHEESSKRLKDLHKRYDEEMSVLGGGNAGLRDQKREFSHAMDQMQQPLIDALNMRFAGRIKPSKKV